MMRKAYWVVIVCMGLVSLFFLLSTERKESPIVIYTDVAAKSFYLSEVTDDLIIDVYMSHRDLFYTDLEYLSTSSITDADQHIPLPIRSIQYIGKLEFETIGPLFHYQFRFHCDTTFTSSFHIEFENALLVLEYYPNLMISLPIGSLEIRHHAYDTEEHMSLFRLYAIPGSHNRCPVMNGIVLGLEPKTSVEMVIMNVRLGIVDATFHNLDVFVLKESAKQGTTPGPDDFFKSESPPIIQNMYTYLFLPFDSLPLHRFSLIIQYRVGAEEHTFIIDDFIYFSIPITGGCYERQLQRTVISHFRS